MGKIILLLGIFASPNSCDMSSSNTKLLPSSQNPPAFYMYFNFFESNFRFIHLLRPYSISGKTILHGHDGVKLISAVMELVFQKTDGDT